MRPSLAAQVAEPGRAEQESLKVLVQGKSISSNATQKHTAGHIKFDDVVVVVGAGLIVREVALAVAILVFGVGWRPSDQNIALTTKHLRHFKLCP